MKKIIEYTIVKAPSSDELIMKVNSYIVNYDWQPLGGISIYVSGFKFYYQVMVKYEN